MAVSSIEYWTAGAAEHEAVRLAAVAGMAI